MTNGRIERNSTFVPNETLEVLAKAPLNGRELRIIILLLRQTYGYWRDEVHLGPQFLWEKTGIDPKNCYHAVARLKALGIISSSRPGTYRVNDPSQWQLPAAHPLTREPRRATPTQATTRHGVADDTSQVSPMTPGGVADDTSQVSPMTPGGVADDTSQVSPMTPGGVADDTSADRSRSKKNLLKKTLKKTKIPDGLSPVGGKHPPLKKTPKDDPDPRVREILRAVETRLGYPIAHWAREAAAVRRGLLLGYTPEEILGCWETMRVIDLGEVTVQVTKVGVDSHTRQGRWQLVRQDGLQGGAEHAEYAE